jgi:pimeloyl-ACP methyl ester carboxylesterase
MTSSRRRAGARWVVGALPAAAVAGKAAAQAAEAPRGFDAPLPAPVGVEWYLPVEGGCRLYVYEVGRGPDTAVVLHGGFGAEHGYVLDAVHGLEGRHRFVFYDQRGSLRSPCPDSLVSLDAHVADLDRLRAALSLRRATLIGHSMGTVLAMAYVQRYPERVRGVVLTGTVPPRAPTAADSARDAADAAAAQAFRTRPAVQAELRRASVDGDPAVLAPKQQTEAWRIRYAAANLHHVERWRALKGGQVFYNARAGRAAGQTVPRDYDYTPALLGHACSVTVIIGDHDFVDWGGVRHQAWTRGAPNATVVVLRDAGHNAWLDAPDPFRDALEAALARSAQCPAP